MSLPSYNSTFVSSKNLRRLQKLVNKYLNSKSKEFEKSPSKNKYTSYKLLGLHFINYQSANKPRVYAQFLIRSFDINLNLFHTR